MKNEKRDLCTSSQNDVKPMPIPDFTIDRETLEHLPDMHRIAALAAIRDGRWRLVENTKEVKK